MKLNIKDLLEALNPSRQLLIGITVTAVAAIPTIWVVSSRNTEKKVKDDGRLEGLENSVSLIQEDIKGLYTKFDQAEQKFVEHYEKGIGEIGEIIKESDRKQTKQLEFVIKNWSTENKNLINEAIELNQVNNEKIIDEMIEKSKKNSYQGDALIRKKNEPHPQYYEVNKVPITVLDSIQKEYKILSVELAGSGLYNINYRDFTSVEKSKLNNNEW